VECASALALSVSFSLTPNFSWVDVVAIDPQPFQRFSLFQTPLASAVPGASSELRVHPASLSISLSIFLPKIPSINFSHKNVRWCPLLSLPVRYCPIRNPNAPVAKKPVLK
jgi:hypothetical protein